MTTTPYSGLDLLVTAVLVLDGGHAACYLNPAAENLFAVSSHHVLGQRLENIFGDAALLKAAIGYADRQNCSYTEHDLVLAVGGHAALHLSCTVTPVEVTGNRMLLIEFRPIDQQLKIEREERLLDQNQANRELIRNLAHEIKNPLGGIRGAAQLLARELERADLREYTQVIMQEADRLQALMDRMLTPHHLPQPCEINIHELLEQVRSLILAEMPGLAIRRDYDISLPAVVGDRAQLIQALLNIVRNAAQALQGTGEIVLRTRVARQVTLAKKRYRHALQLQIIDDGPGIPEELREKIFFPLVSGREGGSGLGLTIAQTFVTQHHGTIEVESVPGRTCFTILLPLVENGSAGQRPS
ncbi:MAG: nitrogen regulation protein NR(II) [Pseudomonadota bacterium]